MLHAQGDLTGARARLERSLAIYQIAYGTETHPDVAASLHELARVLRAQSDHDGARAHFERSLRIQRNVYGTEDHPDTATTYHELGNCLRDLRLFDESERAFRTALRIHEAVGTRDSRAYAETEFTLARLLYQCGRRDESYDFVRHAMGVLQVQAPNHPLLALQAWRCDDDA